MNGWSSGRGEGGTHGLEVALKVHIQIRTAVLEPRRHVLSPHGNVSPTEMNIRGGSRHEPCASATRHL